MQDPIIDNTSQVKQKNLNDTVWQSRKGRQQTEKDIELLLNRLQLLKKEETFMHKKLTETKNRTQIVVDKKSKNQLLHETKKNTKLGDDEKLREFQRRNFELKCKQEEERKMIMDAIHQIKRQEYEEVKFPFYLYILRKIQKDNKNTIHNYKQGLIEKNILKKDQVQLHLSQSRSNINLYWSNKLENISKIHEQYLLINIVRNKIENYEAQSKNEIIMGRLEEEEMSMINKLQKSQEIQDQLSRRLDRAINLPHNEFKRMYGVDTDINFNTGIPLKQKIRRPQMLTSQSELQMTTIAKQGETIITEEEVENQKKTDNDIKLESQKDLQLSKSEQTSPNHQAVGPDEAFEDNNQSIIPHAEDQHSLESQNKNQNSRSQQQEHDNIQQSNQENPDQHEHPKEMHKGEEIQVEKQSTDHQEFHDSHKNVDHQEPTEHHNQKESLQNQENEGVKEDIEDQPPQDQQENPKQVQQETPKHQES